MFTAHPLVELPCPRSESRSDCLDNPRATHPEYKMNLLGAPTEAAESLFAFMCSLCALELPMTLSAVAGTFAENEEYCAAVLLFTSRGICRVSEAMDICAASSSHAAPRNKQKEGQKKVFSKMFG